MADDIPDTSLPPDGIVVTGGVPQPRGKGMRTGFTTGACATAAALGATQALLEGHPVRSVVVTLPAGRQVRFLLQRCTLHGQQAHCSVIKDAGDDPDVTHGAEICADVARSPIPGIALLGGEGVGTVTRPGLGLEVGGPAINPVPRHMILQHVGSLAGERLREQGLTVTISVPKGRELALKTLNGRLGIVGGLSILGTTGIVQPFSTAAWRASVGQSIDVAAANGIREVLMSTGGRSERFGQDLLGLSDMALIEMGEFTGFALQRAAQHGMQTVHLCGMIGKYAKMAQGHLMTHVAGNQVDPAFLAAVATEAGASPGLAAAMSQANTARHVQELTIAAGFPQLFTAICERVAEHCQAHVGGALTLDVIMFDFDGRVLGRAARPAGTPVAPALSRPKALHSAGTLPPEGSQEGVVS